MRRFFSLACVSRDVLGRLFKPPYIWFLPGLIGVLGAACYFIALDTVSVRVDGRTITRRTLASTVAQVLREDSVKLNPGDEVSPGLKTRVSEGMIVSVKRAVPVYIAVDGTEKEFRTVPVTVGETLRRAGIKLGAEDRVSFPLDSRISPGQKIRVIRVTSRVVTDFVRVDPPVEYVKDKNLDQGVRKIIQAGRPGRVKRTVKIVYEDGRIAGYKVLAKTLLKSPLKQIIAVGVRPIVYTLTTSRGRVIRYTKVWTMTATAYYPGPESCGKEANGYTYSGKRAGYGVVAVDKRRIPLGTMLYIEGYGVAEAADIGSAIKGNRIDLCFDTYREAKMYGVKRVKVYFMAP